MKVLWSNEMALRTVCINFRTCIFLVKNFVQWIVLYVPLDVVYFFLWAFYTFTSTGRTFPRHVKPYCKRIIWGNSIVSVIQSCEPDGGVRLDRRLSMCISCLHMLWLTMCCTCQVHAQKNAPRMYGMIPDGIMRDRILDKKFTLLLDIMQLSI